MKTKIIFISGIPATGKSTIAKALAVKLKIDKVIDLDVLKNTCKIFKSKEEDGYLYTTTHQAWELENLEFFEGYKKYCDCIQGYLLKLLSEMTNEKMIIVEGAQLEKDIFDKIDSLKFEAYFFTLYLDEKTLVKRIKQKMKLREGKWLENFDKLIKLQKHLLEENNENVIKNNSKNLTLRKIIKEIKK